MLQYNTVNSHSSATICFQDTRWSNEFGRLTGYSLLIVYYTYWYWEVLVDKMACGMKLGCISKKSLYLVKTCL